MHMRTTLSATLTAPAAIFGCLTLLGTRSETLGQQEPIPTANSLLPKPDPAFKGKIGETFANSTPSFPQPVKAKPGSPNVLIILTDDTGFGMTSTFGGPAP